MRYGRSFFRFAVLIIFFSPLASLNIFKGNEAIRGGSDAGSGEDEDKIAQSSGVLKVQSAAARDVSPPLMSVSVEQTEHGTKPPPEIVASFEGLGEGFEGPQGTATFRNPSDNSLAVGPDHIVQIVNSQMAIFTKKGSRFDTTGKALYGPIPTNNVFRGFAGEAAQINNGDAVVRYDQLADRWLIVMPIFRRLPRRENEPAPGKSGDPVQVSQPSVAGQPGPAEPLYQPPPLTPEEKAAATEARAQRRGQAQRQGQTQRRGQDQRRGQEQTRVPRNEGGSYAMCYAISTSPDPLGSYYRYQFVRPLFPDYPRPAIWPDGYYIPTSTGDNIIQIKNNRIYDLPVAECKQLAYKYLRAAACSLDFPH